MVSESLRISHKFLRILQDSDYFLSKMAHKFGKVFIFYVNLATLTPAHIQGLCLHE